MGRPIARLVPVTARKLDEVDRPRWRRAAPYPATIRAPFEAARSVRVDDGPDAGELLSALRDDGALVIYLDSSAIVKLIQVESESPGAGATGSNARTEPPVSRRLLRGGRGTAGPAPVGAPHSLAGDARSCSPESAGSRWMPSVRATAGAYVTDAVRSLDAIHLATAEMLIAGPARPVSAFVTYDTRQAAAVEADRDPRWRCRVGVRVGAVEYTRLGGTGLQVSRICLGMMSYGVPTWRDWVLDLDAARPLVRSAVDAGIIFFDTADMYSDGASEEVTGALLREFFARRDDYVLATKVFIPMGAGPNDRGLSRKHVLASIDASLRRLGTDHVDLYQIHRWDPTRRSRRRWRRCTTSCAPARPATSARRACTRGSSRRPSTSPSGTGGPASSRCRTTTTCSTARRSGRCTRCASTRASA